MVVLKVATYEEIAAGKKCKDRGSSQILIQSRWFVFNPIISHFKINEMIRACY
jgi:hypothetical protein